MPPTQVCTPRTLPATDVRSLARAALAELRARQARAPDAVRKRLDLLADAFCAPDEAASAALIARLQGDGINGHEIIEHVLPAVARLMGERWMDDSASFADVTISVGRMQRQLRRLASADPVPAFPASACPGPAASARSAPRILIWVPPGEDHTFGAFTAAEALRARGADVTLALGDTDARLLRRLGLGRFQAIAISVGQTRLLARVGRTVDRLKRSGAARVPILLGGAVVREGEAGNGAGADRIAEAPADILAAVRTRA